MSARASYPQLDEDAQAAVDRVVANMQRPHCKRLLFITGAGISADSGLPTYRGTGGLYEETDTDEGVSIEDALSGAMLRSNPALCWKYIAQIEAGCRGASANRGHEVIAHLADRYEVWVLTQNVDGLHRAAGSSKIIDIHGDVHTLQCTSCLYQVVVDDYAEVTIPPHCPKCEALVRPDVVLFGEMLPSEKLKDLSRELENGFDMVFSVGTTSVFQYIAAPVWIAKQSAIPTVEINPGTTEVSQIVDERITHGAALSLGAIWERLEHP